jgi:hypothetical protein
VLFYRRQGLEDTWGPSFNVECTTTADATAADADEEAGNSDEDEQNSSDNNADGSVHGSDNGEQSDASEPWDESQANDEEY